MQRLYERREPDQVPITDWAWESTIWRWRREGMPQGLGWDRFFDIDRFVYLSVADINTSPRFEQRVIEETDTYRIEVDQWGVTKKNFKPVSSTPAYLDFEVKDADTWRAAKQRMQPSRDRINWEKLRTNWKTWREEGAWIIVAPWYGYDVVSTRMCGTETILAAMANDPEWAVNAFNHGCDLTLALLDMVWDEGYSFDELFFFDDMAYKKGMFFSKRMWREMVMPYQKRAIDWAHAHGIKAHLHCCGNISALIPELIDLGLDALNPLEVKAGMDPTGKKRLYGKDLVLKGGCNALLWDDWEKVEAQMKTLIPGMMEGGGYIFSSDHSIPDYTSLETYRRIVALARALGKY
jgi:uroporphyrinogen decarboxylase